MIITRSPLRISLGGGGTDLPSYYEKHTGFLIAAAIDKYVCITLHQTFVPELILKYSQLERVKCIEEIHHPLMRESLRLVGVEIAGLEITSMADIPAGTGLGSSGSFTTALLKALHTHKKNLIHPSELAEQACHIEIERLREPVGKQDQYIASYGGLTCFQFLPDGKVEAWPLRISSETLYNLEDNLLLFFTGYSRSAATILKEQDDRSKKSDRGMVDNLHFVKELGQQSKEALEGGDLVRFAELMNVHWEHKKKRSRGMSNSEIDRWYALARANGALGGKLIGAGGGGFLLFYAEDKTRLRRAMAQTRLREVRFRFDFEGTKCVAANRTRNWRTCTVDIATVPAALLSGGLATRLRPLTTRLPKAMVEVAGRPFIDHQLALLRCNGIRRVVLCLGHLGEQIERHLGDGAQYDLCLRYSYDGDRLLGTGGALRRALPLLGEVFWVLYGDSYMDIDYRAVLAHFAARPARGLMTILENDNRWDRSNVVFRDGRLLCYSKRAPTPRMKHIDYGVTLLTREALASLPLDEPSDLADLLSDLAANGELIGHEVTQRFYEIGSHRGLEETQRYLQARCA